MKYKYIRVGSSHNRERLEELKSNHESEELKTLIKDGFKVVNTRVKRPRIQNKKEKFKVIITCFGPMKVTIEEFNERCKDFKTI